MPTNNPKLLEHVRKNFCIACGGCNYIDELDGLPRVEAHHIQEKGYGGGNGGDDWWNLLYLCTLCHTMGKINWHDGIRRFLEEYPHVWNYMRFIGWDVIVTADQFKLIHPAYVGLKPKEVPTWVIPWETVQKYLKPKQNQIKQGGSR